MSMIRYEYKGKVQTSNKFKEALAEMRSQDPETRAKGIDSIVGYVADSTQYSPFPLLLTLPASSSLSITLL
jgi:hypothetical protein